MKDITIYTSEGGKEAIDDGIRNFMKAHNIVVETYIDDAIYYDPTDPDYRYRYTTSTNSFKCQTGDPKDFDKQPELYRLKYDDRKAGDTYKVKPKP